MLKYRKLFPLFLIQFFTWLGLFSLWIYATPVIAKQFFSNKGNLDFEKAAKWVGICFALYSVFGTFIAFFFRNILKNKCKFLIHSVALFFGGLGLISIYFVPSKYTLLLSFLLVGIAWSSISTTPYVIVGDIAPEKDSEKFYSFFNFSTVIPQVVASFLLAYITKDLFHGEMMKTLFLGGIFMCIASGISLFIHLTKL